MGNEESTAVPVNAKIYDPFAYAQVGIERTRQQVVDRSTPSGPLLRTAYNGIWSMHYSESLPPITRIGQCHVYDAVTDRVFIAYGADKEGRCLNDAWFYDFKTERWGILARKLIGPRKNASAVLIGRRMVMFGGSNGMTYFSDLHYLDIDTGEVSLCQINGPSPSPRENPVLFAKENTIFMWSGTDGNIRCGIHSIDLNEMTWKKCESGHSGREAAAFCEYKGHYYVFGSSKGHGLLEFFPETLSFEPIECRGTEPNTDLSCASLFGADEYLFLIGGISDSTHMHIFALDIKRKWWFAFHVRPDNETLSLSDGSINKIGLYMLPREHSAAVFYRECTRQIVSVMGSKMLDPAPLFFISIGNALSILHMRNDMLDVMIM